MAGGRTPGSIGILDKPIYEPYPQEQFRGGGTVPGSLRKGGSSGPTLEGWPRSIGWDEFRDVDSRPSGVEEDAQIETRFEQPRRVSVVREAGRLRLGGYVGTLRVVRSNSWVVSSRKSDSLLRHEQGHFDITGLGARDLIEALRNVRAQTTQELQRQVTRLIQAYQAWGEQLSEQYDAETNHGRNVRTQQEWETRIRNCMQQGTSLGPLPSP